MSQPQTEAWGGAEVFRRRRQNVARRLDDGLAAVVFAGTPRPRNYAANPYPFRADSHFLYLTGLALPGAALWLCGDAAELFVVPEAEDDALWHGPAASWDELRRATGVDRVRDVAELSSVVQGPSPRVVQVPSSCPHTRSEQARSFRPTWTGASRPADVVLDEGDAKLADALIAERLVHDAAALANLRAAAEATVSAHRAGMAATRPGVREAEVRAAMERVLLARGLECAYGSIVTVAGEVLHNHSHAGVLADGDLLLADVGGEHEGFAADVTRTWPVSGRFSPTQRALYEVVLAAQEAAIANVRPGVSYREVHLAACRVLTRGLVDEGLLRGDVDSLVERGVHAIFFPHGIGHLLGLDVHDMEDLGDRAGYAPSRSRSTQFGLSYLRLDRDLAPDMVVTIEPGLYFVPALLRSERLTAAFVRDGALDLSRVARFRDVRGIRIEDDVRCTSGAPEVLTAALPKTPDAVVACVGR